MDRAVDRFSRPSAGQVTPSPLGRLLGTGPRLALAGAVVVLIGVVPALGLAQMHGCSVAAITASPVLSFPATRTYAVEPNGFLCTLTPPPSLFGTVCAAEVVNVELVGTFVVNFGAPGGTGTVPLTISSPLDPNLAHTEPLTICGHILDLSSFTMPLAFQDLTYDPTLPIDPNQPNVTGTTISIHRATVDTIFEAESSDTGTYEGSIDGMSLTFSYSGEWAVTSRVPGISPLGRAILAALLLLAALVAIVRRSRVPRGEPSRG